MATYALQLPNFTFGGPDADLFETVSAMAVAGEASGFESLWVMDHFYQLPMLGGGEEPMLEAYTLLGALAARTKTMKLGTLVTGVTYRNPAMLAKTVTTLDVISGGRAWLGIGAAWHDIEHEGYGFDYPAAGERMDRLEEALQICRAMFRGERPTFAGKHYQTVSAINLPPPIQEGGPRILIGGGGEKRTLRLVAQYADATNLFGDPETVRHKIDVIHRHCADVGRDPAEITVTRLGSMFLTESAEETKSIREMVTSRLGEGYAAATLIGQPDDLAEQLDPLVEIGVQTFIFNLPTARTADDISAAGAALGKAVKA